MKPKIIISKKNEEVRWMAVNDESIEFVLNKVIPSGSQYLFMQDETQIDGSFLFCYDYNFEDENGSNAIPTFNINIAKEVFMESVRNRRAKLFPNLDIEYMKALESGNQEFIQQIVSKKQELRDVTEIDFSNVATPTELKLLWPTDILGESPYTNI